MLPRTTISPRRGSILGTKFEEADKNIDSGKESLEDPILVFNAWMNSVDQLMKDIEVKGIQAVKNWKSVVSKKTYLGIQAWPWLLYHFRDIDTIRQIAAQTWTELVWSAEERKTALQKIIIDGVENVRKTNKILVEAVEKDIFITEKISGFNWVNPHEKPPKLESYCLQDDKFDLCPSSYQTTIDKKIGPAINVKKETGDLFGFLVSRKDRTIVFKTLDKKNSARIVGVVGADCGLSSELSGARGRVKIVQDILREAVPEMSKYLVDTVDSAVARNSEGRQKRIDNLDFKHVDDFSHIYLCMFLEILLRIMDSKKYVDKRWFLNAVETFRAGLKGR
jgi:hypothetical protein